jgi:hypothetical protein
VGRKRNTRRSRREPRRNHVPGRPKQSSNTSEGKPNAQKGKFLIPWFELYIGGSIKALPLELIPLYALTVTAHQAVARRPNYSSVVAAAQFRRSLEYLGFHAEIIAACTSVLHSKHDRSRIMDIGVWRHPPVVRSDGTTDGHAVIWTDSFKRCIDIGICRNPALQRDSRNAPSFEAPAILPSPEGRDKLIRGSFSVGAPRAPYMLTWMFFPEWTSNYGPLLEAHTIIIEHGGLAMAHVAIDLLSMLSLYRDTSKLWELYPSLQPMVSRQHPLPALDSLSDIGSIGAASEDTLMETERRVPRS